MTKTVLALIALTLTAHVLWVLRAVPRGQRHLALLAGVAPTGVVTLAQAKMNAGDDVDRAVIDEFRKSSYLLDSMPFDDVVAGGANGTTLTYGYTRLITQPTAGFRAVNVEYTPQEVTKQQFTHDLKPFGGSYQIDRVLAGIAAGAEVALQMDQKIKAARSLFHDATINGDSAVNANTYDGLNKALAGSSTEVVPNSTTTRFVDWTPASIDTAQKAFIAMTLLDELLSSLDSLDGAVIFTNRRAKLALVHLARVAGYKTGSEDAFGRQIDGINGTPIVDLGEKPGTTTPIIAVETRDPDGAGVGGPITGLTDIYVARLALDGFHAASRAGFPLVQQWPPDFTTSGAVKTGEVEMVACVALKKTKAAAVLRNVKVQ